MANLGSHDDLGYPQADIDERPQMAEPRQPKARDILGMPAAINFWSIRRELTGGSMNPQHLELLSDWGDLYRHFITFAFTQHGPAQRGFAADDLNELRAAA